MRSTRRDGGYGWVIVFAFFLSEFLMDGIRFSFGMLYVEWLQYFKKGKGDTAWIGSIMIGVYNLGGPLFVLVVNKLGCRPAYILGALLSTTGFLLSFFAPNVYFLYFSFGILPGLGFGIVMLAGTVSVGRYFFKKRALAIGISYSGTGFGTMIFNPLARVLLDNYGWRGAMFVFASLALNLCVLGSLHRPFVGSEDNEKSGPSLKQDKSGTKSRRSLRKLNSDTVKSEMVIGNDLKTDNDADQALAMEKFDGKKTDVAEDEEIQKEKESIANYKAVNKAIKENARLFDNVREISVLHNPNTDVDQLKNDTQSKSVNETDAEEKEPMLKSVTTESTVNLKYNQNVECTHDHEQVNGIIHVAGSQSSLPNKLNHRLQPKLNGSFSSLSSLKKSQLMVPQNMFGSGASFEILFERQKGAMTVTDHRNENTNDTPPGNVFLTLIRNTFPKDLVTNINFILLMVATFFFGVAAYIPVALLPDYCLYVGCQIEETGWLISVFGVTGIISRVVTGWLTDIPCVNRLVFFLSVILFIGIITLLCPVLQSFELLMLYAAVFGFAMGSTYVVHPIFLFEYFGDQYLVEIFGILMLVYGVSTLIGTPAAGWLFDGTGNYSISFLFAGANCILSGALHIFVLCSKPVRQSSTL